MDFKKHTLHALDALNEGDKKMEYKDAFMILSDAIIKNAHRDYLLGVIDTVDALAEADKTVEPIEEPETEVNAAEPKPEVTPSKPVKKTSTKKPTAKKGKNSKLTEDEIGKIKALYEGGWRMQAIADELHLGYNTVNRYVHKMDLKVRPRGGKPMETNWEALD